MKQQERPTVQFRSVRERPRRLRKVGKIALIVGLVVGVLAGGTFFYVKHHVDVAVGRMQDKSIVVDPLPPKQPYNILVLGSDARSVVDPSQRDERQFRGSGGHLADTMMVIHVPTDQRSATVLSFPRDLRVQIPGKSGYSKINASYAGGPNLVIKTIKALTGLEIHHYIEINFASFQKIVDAVGGIRLCVDRPYNDKQSGLIVPKAGCKIYDGELALAYVRMRKSDPKGDFGRIDRQQTFIRELMKKLKSIGFLLDIPRLLKTVDAVSAGVRTDQGLDEPELRGIANKLAGFKESKVDFRVVPSFPKYISGVSWVIAREAQARAIYEALRDDKPLPDYGKTGASLPQPQDVSMIILNGTTTSGLAAKYRDEFRDIGYKVNSTGNASHRDYAKTTILFKFGADAKAELVASEFPGAIVQEAPAGQEVDVVVILGADVVPSPAPSPG